MRWLLIVTLLYRATSAFAGNEAGGDWIRNRFLARTYDLVALLCETDEKTHGYTREEIRQIERQVREVPVEVRESEKVDAAVEKSGGTKIVLSRANWVKYFASDLDVYREILALYWEGTLGKAPKALSAPDTVTLRRRRQPREPWQRFRLGRLYWALRSEPATREEASAVCGSLNKVPAFSVAYSWQQPTMASARPAVDAIADVLGQQEAEPVHFEYWTEEGRLSWWREAGLVPVNGERATVLCQGFTR